MATAMTIQGISFCPPLPKHSAFFAQVLTSLQSPLASVSAATRPQSDRRTVFVAVAAFWISVVAFKEFRRAQTTERKQVYLWDEGG